ncbi:hypothetical protein FS837_005976 [Tulasnella sp. UAMH 9824]|nr:hypothetical protein FS837_005976 [Tulasnella sp. UAMH 9824]
MASGGRSPKLLLELGDMHRYQGDYVKASDFYKQALDAYTDIADTRGRAMSMWNMAEADRALGKSGEAITLYSAALHLFTEIEDEMRADALLGLAKAYSDRGDSGKAIALFSEAKELLTTDSRGRANALCGLATVYLVGNNYYSAFTRFSEALEVFKSIGDRLGGAYALWNLADIRCRQGRNWEAIQVYEQAAEIFQQIGRTETAAEVLEEIAAVRRLLNRDSKEPLASRDSIPEYLRFILDQPFRFSI